MLPIVSKKVVYNLIKQHKVQVLQSKTLISTVKEIKTIYSGLINVDDIMFFKRSKYVEFKIKIGGGSFSIYLIGNFFVLYSIFFDLF